MDSLTYINICRDWNAAASLFAFLSSMSFCLFLDGLSCSLELGAVKLLYHHLRPSKETCLTSLWHFPSQRYAFPVCSHSFSQLQEIIVKALCLFLDKMHVFTCTAWNITIHPFVLWIRLTHIIRAVGTVWNTALNRLESGCPQGSTLSPLGSE